MKLAKIFSQAVSCFSSLVIVNVTVGKVLVFVESVEDFSFWFLAVEAISDDNVALVSESLEDMLAISHRK